MLNSGDNIFVKMTQSNSSDSLAVIKTGTTYSSGSSKSTGFGAYVQDAQTWIDYYKDKKSTDQTFPSQSKPVVVCASKSVEHKATADSVERVQSETQVAVDKNISSDMQDIELVSPVQGAVQQARAEYARATPIKRRKRRKKGSKKRLARKRKQNRKTRKKRRRRRRKKKKPVKKRGRKKRQYRKKKRDIFNE